MRLLPIFLFVPMRNINSSRLTKQMILEKVSQVSIFATYLGIPIEQIQRCIDTGELICNPLRVDVHPTAGFRYNNKGKLKFKDFGNDGFWGDCFDTVAYIMSEMYGKSYDISNKNDFIKVLRHITFIFKDIFYGQEKDITLINSINTAIVNIKRKKPVIELVVRDWNNQDIEYWKQFNVSIPFLNINFIYPVEQYYINRKVNPEPKYYYTIKDPCYGYNLGIDRNGIYNIKLYFPKRKKGQDRFITNCNHLEGIYNLNRNDYDIIVLTKSTKDRVSLGCTIKQALSLYGGVRIDNIGYIDKIRVGVINIPHETYRLRQNEYDWLKNKSINGSIVSLMDNDSTGKREAIWLKRNFGIEPFLINKKYKAKDFADLVKSTPINNVYELIIDAIKYIKTNELQSKREDNKLIRDTNGNNKSLPF